MERSFSVPFGKHQLIGDALLVGEKEPNILVLHGAGQGNRQRYRLLRDFLQENHLGSYSFDLIGHGETGGNLFESSLSERTQQVLSVIKEQRIKEPLVLIGASMGAYTSIKLTELHEVDSLILLVPGIYTKKVYTMAFNDEFSEEIRKDGSWESSDAWEILSRYKGRLLVVGAELDQIIPREIVAKVFDSAVQASEKEIYFVPGAHHVLMRYLAENPDQLKIVFDRILKFAA